MGLPARIKTWVANATVKASDLNTEFSNLTKALTSGEKDANVANVTVVALSANVTVPGNLIITGITNIAGNALIGNAPGDTTTIVGNLTASNVSVTGNITCGDAAADTVNVTGSYAGCRTILHYPGIVNSPGGTSTQLNNERAQDTLTSVGYVMPFAGSITGFGWGGKTTALYGGIPVNLNLFIQKNGSNVWVGGAGTFNAANLGVSLAETPITRNANANVMFAAGDRISIAGVLDDAGNEVLVNGWIEVFGDA